MGRWFGSRKAIAMAGWKDTILKRILALTVALVSLFVVGIAVAHAAVIEIPIDTVVYADEGSVTPLATADTPQDLVGTACGVVAEAKNQSSVHPGNDLIVSSGDDSVVLRDVERAPGAVTEGGGPVTLGTSVTVSLRMGKDEVFSGGVAVKLVECAPPTTTTTEPPATTTTQPSAPTPPVIAIVKTATPEMYGTDGIGHFTIEVTNPGSVDLVDVRVTDEVATAIDPASDCPNPAVPDLAVGASYSYECSVANLDGVSPFTNEATAIGTGPDGTKVNATDDATVFPPVISTTITQPPTTAPPTTVPPTLPNTGVPYEQVRGFSFAGIGMLMAGIALLAAAALVGHIRMMNSTTAVAVGYQELWVKLHPVAKAHTIYIPVQRTDGSDSPPR